MLAGVIAQLTGELEVVASDVDSPELHRKVERLRRSTFDVGEECRRLQRDGGVG